MEEWADSLENAASTAGEKVEEYSTNLDAWTAYHEAMGAESLEEVDEPDDPEMVESEVVEEILGEVDEPAVG
jgi:hypothetical protein